MPDLTTAAGQFTYLSEGCVDIVRPEELKARLERSLATRRPLAVKVGFDPSSADIHLGHVVVMRKMKQFQDCGHQVVFVVGDFTAMIGDPTGRSKTRPQLSRPEITANAETYRRQAAKVLDDTKTQFRYNSEWLEKLGSVGLIRLAAQYNVARMLERRDFRQRYDAGQSIAVHEFLYPLAQAYDSVALAADVELGGTDQLFNLNVGRDIMPGYDLPPQIVMTTPLLEGLDGVEKMSKSLGNYVGVDEPPGEMFGKLMSISDELMWRYWTLLGGVGGETIDAAKAAVVAQVEAPSGADEGGRALAQLGAESFHPKELKIALARRIVTDFHGPPAAREAEAEFRHVFSQRETPSEVETVTRPLAAEGPWLPRLMVEQGLAKSNAEAIRLIQQGGVTVNGQRIDSKEYRLPAAQGASYLLKIGKRRFLRVRFE